MAFGRDGSELELTIYDLQNRVLAEALRRIMMKSRDRELAKLAARALKQARDIEGRLH